MSEEGNGAMIDNRKAMHVPSSQWHRIKLKLRPVLVTGPFQDDMANKWDEHPLEGMQPVRRKTACWGSEQLVNEMSFLSTHWLLWMQHSNSVVMFTSFWTTYSLRLDTITHLPFHPKSNKNSSKTRTINLFWSLARLLEAYFAHQIRGSQS